MQKRKDLARTSAIISADTIPVSSRSSLIAADFGSSPSSIPPCEPQKNSQKTALQCSLIKIISA